MSTVLIHLSDLHYQGNNPESYGVVLEALLNDIRTQLQGIPDADPYVVFSGDLVKEGQDEESYKSLFGALCEELRDIGINKDKIVCVPGNHDICRSMVKSDLAAHEGIVQQLATEDQFNTYIRAPSTLTKKFSKFQQFSRIFSDYSVGESSLGAGWEIGGSIGVYCLNTALCSGAGLSGLNGEMIEDKGRLAVDTRGLHEWLQSRGNGFNVLVMHHPLDWLCDWARRELQALLGRKFQLCLSGHTHEQNSYCAVSAVGQHVHCHAPALYTRKTDPLGYSLIAIDDAPSVSRVTYRQWTSNQIFVSGTAFSHNDQGVVLFDRILEAAARPVSQPGNLQLVQKNSLEQLLKSRLNNALRSFSTQPIVFVEPLLSNHSEVVREKDSEPKPTFSASELLSREESIVVHAPALFGLSCLARHLVLFAWQKNLGVWLYIDAKKTKPNKQSVANAVAEELAALGVAMADVRGIVIDSLRSSDKDAPKLVSKIAECYQGMRLICMRTNDRTGSSVSFESLSGTKIESVFLWSMHRSGIRKVVADYIDAKPIGDEDLITSRIVSDIEVMNIHRTPLNCITLLKVSEIEYEDSPVNRTEMIKRVLHLLFNVDDIPTYKSRPDMKDCEYVLGYFCEQLLRSGETQFLRDKFISALTICCKERLLELDVGVVFDVLFSNSIIVKAGNHFEFRFSYWVFYFAAQRMYHSKSFASYIFEDMRYAQYPELVEFYTGIDRAREDAVSVLTSDLKTACDHFQLKISLPEGFDMFSVAQWTPTPAAIEHMQEEMNEGVQTSNLPASVKDQYADRGYDRSRPYNQDIRNILSEHSYNQMLQAMRAGARALRNSDYIDPALKRNLLNEILRVWEQSSTVILVLVPALAEKGMADFDDVSYILDGSFGNTVQERFTGVLAEIPQNITSYYEDDLFSQKMGPLLIKSIETSEPGLRMHLLALVLMKNRPKGWKQVIQNYIISLAKNSFYLMDVYRCLRSQYQYSYAAPHEIEDMEFLIRMSATKHVTGSKDPGIKLINKFKDKIQVDEGDIIPEREVELIEVDSGAEGIKDKHL